MSSSRTQIRVRCDDVAQNALGTEWAVLDLSPNFSLRLSKDVQALSDVNNLLTDGVLPFSVPFSTTNDLALSLFGSPTLLDKTKTGIEARAHCDGHELPFDMVFFRQKDSSRRSWELEFRRSPNHWLELASEKQLCTIECGTFTLNEANVTAGWAQPKFDAAGAVTDIVRWWIFDYGGWVDLAEPIQFTDPPVKQVWVEDLRPVYSIPEMLRLGFCEIGWTLEGLIFETAWAKALWAYICKRDYYAESRGGLFKLVGKDNSADVNMNTDPLLITSLEYDPGGNAIETAPASGFYYPGIANNLPYKTCYKFKFVGTIENTSGTEWTLKTLLMEFNDSDPPVLTGVVLGEAINTLPANETVGISVEIEADVLPGQRVYMNVGFQDNGILDLVGVTCKKGYFFSFEPCSRALIRGDVPDLKRLIDCNYYLLDLLKGFLHLIDGRVETDWNTKTITVHPRKQASVYGDSTPGFIDESEVIDLTGKLVCDSVRISPVKNDLPRYTRLQFAESTDAYINDLDPLEPPYSRKVLNGLELPDRIDERENPFFEPTLERQSDVLQKLVVASAPPLSLSLTLPNPYLPVLTDNTDGERSFNIMPRVFFAFGDVGQLNTETKYTGLYFEGAAVTEFGYASQKRTLPLNPDFPPHLDASVIYGTDAADLFVTFYLGLTQTNTRGSYADILVLMGMNEWAAWNFRNPFLFTYEGRPVVATAENIRDFAAATELPTPMRLLVEPNVSECCDAPCSCRYIECDYWQDFGQYLSQVTLDSLSLTSFKVDGVEQLAAPVDFGIINLVSINGRPFVTNLVDTLNALEIPYFSFAPSEKDYPEKDDLRYFKIKRPACQTFLIEISTEAAVYFYSDTAMGSKWFSAGDFEPFGYGGNPVSVPADCVTSVEF